MPETNTEQHRFFNIEAQNYFEFLDLSSEVTDITEINNAVEIKRVELRDQRDEVYKPYSEEEKQNITNKYTKYKKSRDEDSKITNEIDKLENKKQLLSQEQDLLEKLILLLQKLPKYNNSPAQKKLNQLTEKIPELLHEIKQQLQQFHEEKQKIAPVEKSDYLERLYKIDKQIEILQNAEQALSNPREVACYKAYIQNTPDSEKKLSITTNDLQDILQQKRALGNLTKAIKCAHKTSDNFLIKLIDIIKDAFDALFSKQTAEVEKASKQLSNKTKELKKLLKIESIAPQNNQSYQDCIDALENLSKYCSSRSKGTNSMNSRLNQSIGKQLSTETFPYNVDEVAKSKNNIKLFTEMKEEVRQELEQSNIAVVSSSDNSSAKTPEPTPQSQSKPATVER